jgi:hypothetical protein
MSPQLRHLGDPAQTIQAKSNRTMQMRDSATAERRHSDDIYIYSDKAGDSSIAQCGLNEVSAL